MSRRSTVSAGRDVWAGSTLGIGREADLRTGLEPPDPGVSRTALSVTVGEGVRLFVANRNGAFVHQWAQPAVWVERGTSVVMTSPRVGVRLIGSARAIEHWVLLEADDVDSGVPGDAARQPGPTRQPPAPKDLTQGQSAAVHAVFREFLCWPPVSGPGPVPLAAAANRLGISSAALQERLTRVQERAYALGIHHQTGVSDPSYVLLLIRHGLIEPRW